MDKCPVSRKAVKAPNHPRNHKGYVREYILQAEKALDKYLPDGAAVHHHTPEQLVICQDHAYHKLIHQRTDAYNACGKANWRKCYLCKEYDDPENLVIKQGSANRKREYAPFHKECMAKHIHDNREKYNGYRNKWRKKAQGE